jgi:5-methyltetrahydropteroyltriglutamate--homocysteine methyltransferase
VTARPFTATIFGSPRIGPHRELKRAIEGYWARCVTRADLKHVAADLRRRTWAA